MTISGGAFTDDGRPSDRRAQACGRLARFGRDTRAVAAIEFALLVPACFWIMFEVLQIGLYFYFSASLYNVTNAATRQILTGSVASQNLTAAQFRSQVLCPLLPSNMSCANVITNVQNVPEGTEPQGFYALTNYAASGSNPRGYTLSSLTTPPMNNNQTSFCIGASGSVIAVQVYYAMPVLGLPWMTGKSTKWNGQSVLFINATTVFKNEPFASSYQGC